MSNTVREQLRQSLVEIAPAFLPGVPLGKQRQTLDAMGAAAVLPEGLEITHRPLAGMETDWLSTPGSSSRHVLLYLHGGGYVMGSRASHRALASRVADACGVRAALPEYRLAPEHPFPAALEDAVSAYRALLDQGFAPSNIAIAGDSAGGGLTAATLLALRDARVPMPGAAVLMSPFTDLTCSGESIRSRAGADPWLSVSALEPVIARYAGDANRADPGLSPLFGELAGLPPTIVHVGDHEILLSDSTRFAALARDAGVEIELQIWPELWHVFQLFAPALPEANDALSHIGRFVRGKLAV